MAIVLRRRIVEVGNHHRSRCPEARAASGRRRKRRRGAVPEPGPVPPVDIHVAPEGLRRPEFPLAEAAGVGSRRPSEAAAAAGHEAAAGGVAPWRRLLLLTGLPLHGCVLASLVGVGVGVSDR